MSYVQTAIRVRSLLSVRVRRKAGAGDVSVSGAVTESVKVNVDDELYSDCGQSTGFGDVYCLRIGF